MNKSNPEVEDQVSYPPHQAQQHIEDLRDALKGKSLEIYYYLAQNPEYHGVREIQRIFDYSSPNLAQYHLKRLYEAELLVKNEQNQYRIIDDPVKLGKLQNQVQIATLWIPHSMVYALSLFLLGFAVIGFFLLELNPIVYPIAVVPVLTILGIQFIRDGRKMLDLYTKASDNS